MTNKWKILKLFLILGFIGVLGVWVMMRQHAETPIEELHAAYTIDMSNKQAVVEAADDIFVAKVIEAGAVVYENKDTPYSSYEVNVTQVLKGNLTKQRLTLQKLGGISQDGTRYIQLEDDLLPEVGGYYLFLAFRQTDGKLLVSGANTTLKLAVKNSGEVKANTLYQQYQKTLKP